jgi:class 3 adenylate cyclase/tetratricopeptide (TPR) repeat protein
VALPLQGRQRRPITILFADIVGSTSLAEGMDAEDWAAIIQPALDRMLAAIKRYEGHVAQVQGDGVLAFFGAPEAHEDDPERAVRAGLDMVDAIADYAPHLPGREGVQLQIRVGVNTGTAVVGAGGGIGQDYTAFGDAVNVAARIQSEARPGAVLITADTHAELHDVIEAEHRGVISVKGKTEPVEAWEVVSWKGSLRRRRGLAGLSSPMVGRDAEMARLAALVPILRAGRGRLAVIIGEPGIGKSRLLRELRESQSGDGAPEWHEGRCLSYGRTLPHHILLDIIRSLLGLRPGVEVSTQLMRDRLAAHVTPSDVDDIVPYLAHLLSAPLEPAVEAEISRLDVKALQERYVERLRRLLSGLATARRPLIVVLEDVHWADEASVGMIERLLTVVDEVPLLLIFTTRPDRDAPGWRLIAAAREILGDALTELRLAALDDDESRTLISHLLAIESLPAQTREYILARADGNPFFVEEVIRMLIERGVVLRTGERWVAAPGVVEVEIPRSIHGLLLARIDRLPDDARLTLRVASVIGRQFASRTLSQVAEMIGAGAGIGGQLGLLEGAGLIELAAVEPDLEYRFRHVLIQEAAYDSILKQERRHLHRAVADVLERLYPERIDELHPVLAMHLEQAGEDERAVDHYIAAAARARQRFANHEAGSFYAHAAALLDSGQDDSEATRRRRAGVGLERVDVGMNFTPPDEQLRQLADIRRDAEVLNDSALLARVHLLTALVRTLRGEQYRSSPELRTALDQALDYGQGAKDPGVRGLPLALLGEAKYRASDFQQAVSDLRVAIPLLEEGGEIMQASLYGGTLAVAYAHLGRFEEAVAAVDRSTELGRQSGDPTAIIDADLARSEIEALLGNPEAAILYAGRAAEQADRIDNKACAIVAREVLGDQRLMRGAVWEAIDVLQEGAELAAYCDLVPVRIELSRALLDSARAAAGLAEPSVEGFERAAGLARAIGDRLSEGEVLRQRARHRLRTSGEIEAALGDFSEAERLFEALAARPSLAQTLREHAEALSSAGRANEAGQFATRAAALLNEMGIPDRFRRRDDIPSEVVAENH